MTMVNLHDCGLSSYNVEDNYKIQEISNIHNIRVELLQRFQFLAGQLLTTPDFVERDIYDGTKDDVEKSSITPWRGIYRLQSPGRVEFSIHNPDKIMLEGAYKVAVRALKILIQFDGNVEVSGAIYLQDKAVDSLVGFNDAFKKVDVDSHSKKRNRPEEG